MSSILHVYACIRATFKAFVFVLSVCSIARIKGNWQYYKGVTKNGT